jgi:hypothetical protein
MFNNVHRALFGGSCAVTNKITSTISHDRTWRGSKVQSDLIVNIRVLFHLRTRKITMENVKDPEFTMVRNGPEEDLHIPCFNQHEAFLGLFPCCTACFNLVSFSSRRRQPSSGFVGPTSRPTGFSHASPSSASASSLPSSWPS